VIVTLVLKFTAMINSETLYNSQFIALKFIEAEKARRKICIYTSIVVFMLNLYGYFRHCEIFINQNCVTHFHLKM
jgi:hypothetical protein